MDGATRAVVTQSPLFTQFENNTTREKPAAIEHVLQEHHVSRRVPCVYGKETDTPTAFQSSVRRAKGAHAPQRGQGGRTESNPAPTYRGFQGIPTLVRPSKHGVAVRVDCPMMVLRAPAHSATEFVLSTPILSHSPSRPKNQKSCITTK